MKSYYLWSPGGNAWSKQALPLLAILQQPGVTDESLLADAASNQLLTVAQARSCTDRKLKLTTPENSVLKHCLQKIQPKATISMEYKVLSLKDTCLGGNFDADALTYTLNAHSRQGWHVHSCQMTTTSSSHGEWSEALLVILQRRSRGCECASGRGKRSKGE